jgi:multidrug resistance protein, MATE family
MAMALAVGFMSLAALTFLLLPRPVLEIYSRDGRILVLGARILAIVAAFQIFDGVQSVATGALRGIGDTQFPMLANFVGYWALGLPLGAWLCFGAHLGLAGLWMGLTLALVTIATVLALRWKSAGSNGLAG